MVDPSTNDLKMEVLEFPFSKGLFFVSLAPCSEPVDSHADLGDCLLAILD